MSANIQYRFTTQNYASDQQEMTSGKYGQKPCLENNKQIKYAQIAA